MNPDPYGLLCHELRKKADVDGAAIMLVSGDSAANGFFMDCPDDAVRARVPVVLRIIADQIESHSAEKCKVGAHTMLALEVVRAAVEAEPNLPGEMPDELWQICCKSNADCTEFMRAVVTKTQVGILNRLESLVPKPKYET